MADTDEAIREARRHVRRTFLRLAWRLNVTPSELLDMRVADVLARLRR